MLNEKVLLVKNFLDDNQMENVNKIQVLESETDLNDFSVQYGFKIGCLMKFDGFELNKFWSNKRNIQKIENFV